MLVSVLAGVAMTSHEQLIWVQYFERFKHFKSPFEKTILREPKECNDVRSLCCLIQPVQIRRCVCTLALTYSYV